MKKYPFMFDPRKKGLRKILGETEHVIMEILWKRGESNVREVCEAIRKQKNLAYTTVMTVMARLHEKGLLKRRKQGKGYLYQAVTTEEKFTRSIVRRVMEGLLRDFSEPTMSQFLSSLEELSPDRVEKLSRLIEEKRRKIDD